MPSPAKAGEGKHGWLSMTQRALIIGGSLAGMFAAHLLRANGWRVDVFERSAEDLAGRGAGLGSHEALVAILTRIGIDFSTPLGVSIPRYVWLEKDGSVVADVPRPRLGMAAAAAPTEVPGPAGGP